MSILKKIDFLVFFTSCLTLVGGCASKENREEFLHTSSIQEERIIKLETLNQTYKDQLTQLRNTNEIHKQEINQLENQKQVYNEQTAKLKSKNQTQQKQISQLEDENQNLQNKLGRFENLHEEKQSQIAQLNKKIQKLESNLTKLNNVIQVLRVEVSLKDKYLEIITGDSYETVAKINPSSAIPLITFEIDDPNIATIEPSSASSISQTLRITGIKSGQTQLFVRAEGRLCSEATIKVKYPTLLTKLNRITKSSLGTLFLLLISGVGYLIAYHTYGRFLAKKIFKLDKNVPVPSKELQDGIDYVPARKGIIFGHHYTSIAGTGPIVGPAIGIIWGWLPAMLWIFFGSIFMGAVHDFGALVVSLRNEGKSLSEVAAKYINMRVRFIFFAVVFLSLLIVIAIFGVVIAAVFTRFPEAVVPVWLQIPIAMALGFAVYKKNANIVIATTIAVIGMYLCIAIGGLIPITLGSAFGIPSTGLWVIILLIYAWVASTLPVTTLLQPRDYINAWQLFIAMGLLVGGTVVSSLSGNLPLVAPAVNSKLPANTPPILPFIFVTIACGAISGFHSLVASGTSSKQISKEPDCQFVGYGSMILEGFLATLVLICVGAGIGMALKLDNGTILTGQAAWQHQYSTWIGAKGLTDKIAPVVIGAANMMGKIGLPETVGITLMGVFIASFAGTTLDTSTRIQRYVISELASDLRIPLLSNRWAATTFAVLSAAGLAFATGADGTGAMVLWPLFGSANQLLAALALLLVTLYLKRKGGMKFIVTALPCLVMLVITSWAMVKNEIIFINKNNWLLVIIGGVIFALAIWMTIEALITFGSQCSKNRPQKADAST